MDIENFLNLSFENKMNALDEIKNDCKLRYKNLREKYNDDSFRESLIRIEFDGINQEIKKVVKAGCLYAHVENLFNRISKFLCSSFF